MGWGEAGGGGGGWVGGWVVHTHTHLSGIKASSQLC